MIRNIKKIEWVKLTNPATLAILPGKAKVFLQGQICTKVNIVGLASMQVTENMKNGIRLYTTKITATLPARLPHDSNPKAVKLTDVLGKKYLVGLSSAPYPLITQEDKFADKASEKSACTLSITLTSSYPAMEIIDCNFL